MDNASSLKARSISLAGSLSSCEVATVQQASSRPSRADDAAVVLQTGRAQCLWPSPMRRRLSFILNQWRQRWIQRYQLSFALLSPPSPSPSLPTRRLCFTFALLLRPSHTYYLFVLLFCSLRASLLSFSSSPCRPRRPSRSSETARF